MPRISQLTAKTTPASGDEIAIVEVATSTTKKITRADLLKGADLPNDTVTTSAIKDKAVTTDKIADGAVTAPKIDPALINYSTSEVNTGAKWIDGKAIYKRTFSFDRGTGTHYSLTLPSGIEDVIKVEGFIRATTGPNMVPLSYAGGTVSSYVSYFRNSATTMRFDAGPDFTATYRNVRATLFYTKS